MVNFLIIFVILTAVGWSTTRGLLFFVNDTLILGEYGPGSYHIVYDLMASNPVSLVFVDKVEWNLRAELLSAVTYVDGLSAFDTVNPILAITKFVPFPFVMLVVPSENSTLVSVEGTITVAVVEETRILDIVDIACGAAAFAALLLGFANIVYTAKTRHQRYYRV